MAKILMADDEPQFQESYKERLKGDGHTVLIATSARDALNMLDSHPDINLLVLDIMMPYERLEDLLRMGVAAVVSAAETDVWTGVRLYRKIKSDYPRLKVVILSVLSEADIRNEAPSLAFDCPFLRKGGANSDGNYDVIRSVLAER